MENIFVDPAFYWPTIVGFAGVFVWLLKKFAPSEDDTLTAALKGALIKHSRSTLISIIGYVGVCVILFEASQLNFAAALASGYMGQSLTEEVFARRAKKLNGDGNGNGH
jgi:hypothetical protein